MALLARFQPVMDSAEFGARGLSGTDHVAEEMDPYPLSLMIGIKGNGSTSMMRHQEEDHRHATSQSISIVRPCRQRQ